jgi:hypothetical protein
MPAGVQAPNRRDRTAELPQAGRPTVEGAIKIAIDALGELGLRGGRVVIVGGRHLDERSALALGADVFCPDASAALETAEALCNPHSPRGTRGAI